MKEPGAAPTRVSGVFTIQAVIGIAGAAMLLRALKRALAQARSIGVSLRTPLWDRLPGYKLNP